MLAGELAGCALPGSEESLRALAEAGVGAVLTLTPEPLPRVWLEAGGLRSVHIPVVDFNAPTPTQIGEAVAAIDEILAAGRAVVVHCAAGRGRTGTVLAAYLVHRGADPEAAIVPVRRMRPGSIETAGQVAAVHAFASRQADVRRTDGCRA